MIPYVGCEHARELLPGLIDDELVVDDQVALESHLRWCRTCAAHVEDLRLIGDSLRMVAAAAPFGGMDDDDRDVLGGIQAGVLTRVKAEQDQSLTTRVRRLFDDMHVLWAGLGATTAAAVALVVAMAVMHASQNLKAESLAAVIDILSKPGSDQNPMRLSQVIVPPRIFIPDYSDSTRPMGTPEDDAVFTLATVVTREGRISASALLSSQYQADGRQPPAKGTPSIDDESMLRFAVAQTRFAPAVSVEGPVAVNMVWLIARTTVKGSPTALDDLMVQPHAVRPRRAS